MNPGLPPRHVNAHAKSYLNRVKSIDQSLFCSTCKLIARKDTPTTHCANSDYCIERLVGYSKWVGKCLTKKMQPYIKTLQGVSLLLLIYFVAVSLYLMETGSAVSEAKSDK